MKWNLRPQDARPTSTPTSPPHPGKQVGLLVGGAEGWSASVLGSQAGALNREGQAVVWEEGALQPPPQPNQGRPSGGQRGVQNKATWVLLRRLLLWTERGSRGLIPSALAGALQRTEARGEGERV